MDNEIDKTEVITGVFGLVTARLEDAHETSVTGQAQVMACNAGNYAMEIESQLNEITILLRAVHLLAK